MNQERIFQIIKVPHISEKSALLGDSANQAVFQVSTDAKKAEIKEAAVPGGCSHHPMFKRCVAIVIIAAQPNG